MLNVVVVFPRIEDATRIRNLLVKQGIQVTAVCSTGAQVIQVTDGMDDGVIVSGYRLPDMQYSHLRDYLPKEFYILLVASQTHLHEISGEDVVYLPLPIKGYDLVGAIEDIESLILLNRKKKATRERSKEEQIVIAQAKMKLMREREYTEEEAHRFLQKRSMDCGRSLVETCQMIISMN